MKTKASKKPKQSKPAGQLKDIKPEKDAKGGASRGNQSVTGRVTGIAVDP